MKKIAVAIVSVSLMACAATPENNNNQKAKRGAAIGAIAGAILGGTTADKKNRTENAVLGAALGAAIGAGIGNYMDKQEAALRRSLEGSGVDVERDGESIKLTLPESITFGFDQAELDPSFYDTLDQVAGVLAEYDQTLIQVDGHTDSAGGTRYNQLLSERRSGSVANYLQQNGVYYTRITTRGYGASMPVADNATEVGRAQNRRVEMTITEVANH